MPESTRIRVDDVEVSLNPCAHCDAMPGESHAARAIAEWKSRMRSLDCVACGKELRPKAFEIHHVDTGNGGVWAASPDVTSWRTVTLVISATRYDRGLLVHIDCMRRAFPYAPPAAFEQPENARFW